MSSNFHVVREIGRWGMATVYLAEQVSLNREVALKVLDPDLAADPGFADRFQAEGRLIAGMRHRHIVTIYDVGMLDGKAYISMEYLPQGAVSNSAESLSPREVLRCIREIASALHHAHVRGIIHRDVKPENILCHESGAFLLSDFGIARLGRASTITGQGRALGTPAYMSPEQWKQEDLDERSDLYGLGVVLFQLLTGDVPYSGSDHWTTGLLHMTQPVPILPEPYAALQGLLAGLMAKERADRFTTGEQVVAHIESLEREGQVPDVRSTAAIGARLVRRARTSRLLREWPHRAAAAYFEPASSWWQRRGAYVVGAAIAAAALAAGLPWRQRGTTHVSPAPAIAVLPFENLSDDRGSVYFSDGMRDMVLSKLAGIAELKVISRASTDQYPSHPKNLSTLARQLGVTHVVEGSVQKAGDEVLVNLQLIDALNGRNLWAQAYPRKLDNVFGVEGEVAQAVAAVLNAKLSGAEQRSLAALPTQNPAAFDQFMKAEYEATRNQESWHEDDFLAADAKYQQAIALDPQFALAYARLAYNQLERHWTVKHLSDAELTDVKKTIDRALDLQPDLPQAHIALGYYYYFGFRQYDQAATEFEKALQLAPANTQAMAALAFVSRRKGDFPKALALLQKALIASPRDHTLMTEYGATHLIMRHVPEGEQLLTRSLALAPDDDDSKTYLQIARMFGAGDARGARMAYDPPPSWRTSREYLDSGDAYQLINPRVYPDVFERRFDDALAEWETAPLDTEEQRITKRVAIIAIQVVAGRRTASQSECRSVKPAVEKEVADHSDWLGGLMELAWVHACLGNANAAIAAAKRAMDLLPMRQDALNGVFQMAGLAEISAQTGAKDEAFRLIDELMALPAGQTMTFERLKHDPIWDPLRADPRFQAVLDKYAAPRPAVQARSGS